MNNEPVAWMDKETGQVARVACYDIPLYTQKELTDEEILKMAADKFHYSEYKLVIDFARAIMKRCGIISGTDK